MIEPEWLGVTKRHRIVCAEGHETAPRPSDVNQGCGICRTCSRCDPVASEREFRLRLAELGGKALEPYRNTKTPILIRCERGHEVKRTPASVKNGRRCIVCTGNDQNEAWRLFCELVRQRGGQVLEPGPLGVNKPHRVLCPEGHESVAIPTSVRNGLAMCRECGITSGVRAEREFRELIASLGGSIIEPAWLGAATPHRIRCDKGHETMRRPSESRHGIICKVCSGFDSETVWGEFKTRVAELGGTVIEPEWLGNKVRHRVICAYGHETTVRPNNVDQGNGICRFCKCKFWDIFYVVANDTECKVKFGITSHNARTRLRHHLGDGFDRTIMTITDLPDAPDLERAVKSALKLGGAKPVRGYEYFDMSALPVILDIADNWPGVCAAA